MSRFRKSVLTVCALVTLAGTLSACVVAPLEPRPYRDREVVYEHPYHPGWCERRNCR